MQVSKYFFFLLPIVLLFATSCKKTIIEETVYDEVIYQLDTLPVYSSNLEKDREKSDIQFISILYADLFGKAIAGNITGELSELKLSFGDKVTLNQMIVSAFINDPDIKIPDNQQMRDDPEKFVTDIYRKFYLRNPTAYEKYYLVKLINEDPELTVEHFYTAFALSNEYSFY